MTPCCGRRRRPRRDPRAGRNLAWARQLNLPFRVLSDPDGRVARRWGVWDDTWNLTKRVTFVVDRAGRIRYVELGSL
ncbi:MAG: redoxin domain-containing protein, partial [Candidatus Rokuibacteriota bacterium]